MAAAAVLAAANGVELQIKSARGNQGVLTMKNMELSLTNMQLACRSPGGREMAAVFELQKIEGWRFEQPWFGSNYLHFFYPDERGAGQADDTAAREEVYLYFTTGGGADFFTLMTELEARRRYRPEAPAAPTAGAHPVLDMHTAAETAGLVDSHGRVFLVDEDRVRSTAGQQHDPQRQHPASPASRSKSD